MADPYRLASLTGAILLSVVTTNGLAQEQPRETFARLEAQVARLESTSGSAIDSLSLARTHRELWSLRATLAESDDPALREARKRLARLRQRLRDLAQGTARAGATVAAAGTGSISGVITADGGTPLANVVVNAYLLDNGIESAITDAAGRYQVNGLAAGSYKVFAQNRQGFLDELYDDTPCPLGACSLFSQGSRPGHAALASVRLRSD